jgi:hypothetical protein
MNGTAEVSGKGVQFSECSSTTNAHGETVKTAVCCQTLTLGALSSRSALSVLVGALFKKFGHFVNTPRIANRSAALCNQSSYRTSSNDQN